MKQNDQKERVSDWMSLLEDTSVPMAGQAERTDALRARVMQRIPMRKGRRFPVKWLPLAAAIIALTVTAAFAVDCVVNQRLPFIFSSEEELLEAQYENKAESAGTGDDEEYDTMVHSAVTDEPADPEAFVKQGKENIALWFHVADPDDGETMISDEKGTGSNPYTRKQVVSVIDEFPDKTYYYHETRYTGTGLSQIITLEPLLKDWDLSNLDKNYTMVEGCNYLAIRKEYNINFQFAYLWGMYRTANGGVFTVTAVTDTDTNYPENYTDVGEDGFGETYTTQDGVEVGIYGNSQRIYASMALTTEDYHESFTVMGEGVTQQEMKEIVDSLSLSTFVSSFTAAAGGN